MRLLPATKQANDFSIRAGASAAPDRIWREPGESGQTPRYPGPHVAPPARSHFPYRKNTLQNSVKLQVICRTALDRVPVITVVQANGQIVVLRTRTTAEQICAQTVFG